MTQNPYADLPPTPAGTRPPGYPVEEPVIFVDEPVATYPEATYPEATYENGTDNATAKDQAQQVGQGAADAGKQVAGVAKEQARGVAGEAEAQARDVIGQARTEAQQQADTQKQRVTQGLHSISRELDSMADGSQEQGITTDLARQGSQLVKDAASWLDDRDPGALLGEVRTFARRRPGAFLGMALAAGIVSGRLARGLKDSDGDTPANSPVDPIRQDLR